MPKFVIRNIYAHNMTPQSDITADIMLSHPGAISFMDNYFIFDTDKRLSTYSSFKIDTYGFFLCTKGTFCIEIDLKPFRLRPGMLTVYVPGQLVTYKSADKDLFGTRLVMTKRFVSGLGLPYNFSLAADIRENPVLYLKSGELQAIRNYCNMVKNLLSKKRPYQAETLRHLTCAYAYSLGSYLYRMTAGRKLSNEEALMQRFLHELHTYYKKERKVMFYAERLNITAGYLSTLASSVSGRTASEWIDSFVLLEAKIMLTYTNMTIQQISYELHFPSQTFFGKYFKRLTGLSPKEYREGEKVGR